MFEVKTKQPTRTALKRESMPEGVASVACFIIVHAEA